MIDQRTLCTLSMDDVQLQNANASCSDVWLVIYEDGIAILDRQTMVSLLISAIQFIDYRSFTKLPNANETIFALFDVRIMPLLLTYGIVHMVC